MITFDDGYRSVYNAAYPLLKARGGPGNGVSRDGGVVERQPMFVWVNALNWLLRRHPGICGPIACRLLRTPGAPFLCAGPRVARAGSLQSRR